MAQHVESNQSIIYIIFSLQAFSKSESNRAVFAVTALQRLHCLKKQGPRPHSLLLEQALSSSGHHHQGAGFVGDRLILPAPHTAQPLSQAAATANDLAILNSIKESQVRREPVSGAGRLIHIQNVPSHRIQLRPLSSAVNC